MATSDDDDDDDDDVGAGNFLCGTVGSYVVLMVKGFVTERCRIESNRLNERLDFFVG